MIRCVREWAPGGQPPRNRVWGNEFVTGRRWVRAFCFVVIGLAYVMSVPWYRETDAPLRLWLGLPDWVTVALFCYVAVAVFNAVAWSLAEVSDELQDAGPSVSSDSIAPGSRPGHPAQRATPNASRAKDPGGAR